MKTRKIRLGFMAMLLLLMGIILVSKQSSAEERNISLGTQGLEEILVEFGDTGTFTLDTVSEDSVYTPVRDMIGSVQYKNFDDYDEILEVNEDGTFRATGFGTTAVLVTIYDILGEESGSYTYSIVVTKDMTNVTLSKTSFSGKTIANSYETLTFTAGVNGMDGIDENTYGLSFDISDTNPEMYVDVTFSEGTLLFQVSGTGTTDVTVTINGKEFIVTFQILEMNISGATSFYMVPKQSKQLKIKNLGSLKVTWSSTNKNVVSVTGKGKIKAKKTGNAVILADIDGKKVGCVISVLTAARKKVVTRAKYIGTHWTYSQPKRMLKNFYDCSSLVWRCYKLEKKYFGLKNYAPVAADIAKYCAQHKKIIKGNIEKNIQNMKYKPGALTFKTGADNGRYKGIYHVEMFVGYTFEGVTSQGKPVLGTRWGARYDNYDYGAIWAQP